MNRSTLRRRAVRALAVSTATVMALTLSACGGGDDKASDDSGLTTFRVASAGKIPSSMDLVWAIEGGFFEKHGLDVEMTPPIYAADLINTIMNGDAEVAMATGTLVATARSVGRPATVVATSGSPFPLQLVFTDETDQKLRAAGLSETSALPDFLNALKGLTLGTSPTGSSITSAFRFLLSEEGISPEKDKITLQPMPDIPSQIAAVGNGRVDGVVSALGGASTGAAAQGTGVVWDLTKLSGNESLRAIPYANVVTTEAVIKKDPESLQAFLDAMHEAQQSLIAGIPAEDEASLKDILASEMDQKVYDDVSSQVKALFADDFTTSDSTWDVVLKVAQVGADGPLKAPASEAIDNSFAEKVGE